MEKFLLSLGAVPDTNEEQIRSTQRILRNILYVVIVITVLISLIDGIFYNRFSTVYALGPLAILSIISLYYLRSGILWPVVGRD